MAEETSIAPILVERTGTENRIAHVILNRPEKLNALSQDLLEAFEDALRRLERDDTCRVIVIKGNGRAFSPGYDISRRPVDPTAAPDVSSTYQVRDKNERPLLWNTRTNMARVSDFYLYFWNMAKVTIAQVHGYCLAGGVELAMMADLVIAADDAQFGHPGTRGMGTSRTAATWPLLIGMRRAKELLYTGDSLSGKEAAEIGMINRAVPPADLDAEVMRWAERIALQGADSLALQKRSVNAFFEPLIYPGVHTATDTDAMYQFSSQSMLWQEKMREGGMREALGWREGMYRDGPQVH